MGSTKAVIIVINERKMCVVVPHILARGPAARPRCIPPTMATSGYRTHPSPAKRIAVSPLASLGDVPLHLHRTMDQRFDAGPDQRLSRPLKPTRRRLRSPCTHRLGGRSCPQDPRPFHGDDFIQTEQANFRATLSWSLAIDYGAFAPLGTPTLLTMSGLDVVILSNVDHEPRPRPSCTNAIVDNCCD